jgi:hypothetical protein
LAMHNVLSHKMVLVARVSASEESTLTIIA